MDANLSPGALHLLLVMARLMARLIDRDRRLIEQHCSTSVPCADWWEAVTDWSIERSVPTGFIPSAASLASSALERRSLIRIDDTLVYIAEEGTKFLQPDGGVMDAIEWSPGEWADDYEGASKMNTEAWYKGYAASTMPKYSADGVDDTPIGVVWIVKATSEVSEWPEVIAVGTELTLEKAQAAAERCLRRNA